MSYHATVAIKAAALRRTCGRYAARMYALKRGCPMGLYRLACQLHASHVG